MWGIRKCHHFNPKMPILFTYYMEPKTAEISRLELNTKLILSKFPITDILDTNAQFSSQKNPFQMHIHVIGSTCWGIIDQLLILTKTI